MGNRPKHLPSGGKKRATCYVIAPQKLDEQRKGVKTDARDAAVLCQRLSRYVAGNQKELAVIPVPTEEEEPLRHLHRQREALVRAPTKLQAQGRALLVTHGQPALPRWWRPQGWKALGALLPDWLLARLEVFRPVLLELDTQIAALSAELETAAPPELLAGLGKLTSVTLTREVCDRHRFQNRRQVSRLPAPAGVALRAKAPPFGYLAPLDSPAFVPANTPAAANGCRVR